MDVRRLCAQDGAIGLYTWDLAVLGSPRHPGFRTTEELTKVKYICFDFPKMAGKKFISALFVKLYRTE